MTELEMLNKKLDLLTQLVLGNNSAEATRAILSQMNELGSEFSLPVSSKEESRKYVTENFLTNIGVPSNLSGYDYIVTAVNIISENSGALRSITKKLYPEIAKCHPGMTSTRVERSIRHAIEVAWDRCDHDYIHRLFGNTISPSKDKPTNSEFLSRLYQLVEREVKS